MKNCFPHIAAAFILALAGAAHDVHAQTAWSLFRLSDSLMVSEIVSDKADMSAEVGHCGPAVENQYMALRLMFDDSGAIDVYSTSGRGLELEKYGWYPDTAAVAGGAGRDDYAVAGTLGLGGIALWDDGRTVRLEATEGRTARAGRTSKGCYAEMISYGVPYKGEKVDISVRIDMSNKLRTAWVTAKCISRQKVSFVTGVNWHEGASIISGDGRISVWGTHPAEDGTEPVPVGAGMFFSKGVFSAPEKTEDMVIIVSRPCTAVSTKVVAASTREAELNTLRRFETFMSK